MFFFGQAYVERFFSQIHGGLKMAFFLSNLEDGPPLSK